MQLSRQKKKVGKVIVGDLKEVSEGKGRRQEVSEGKNLIKECRQELSEVKNLIKEYRQEISGKNLIKECRQRKNLKEYRQEVSEEKEFSDIFIFLKNKN